MSNAFKRVVFSLFVILLSIDHLSAQNDSIKIEYSEEEITTSNLENKRKYKYIDENLVNEKLIIKFGTTPFGLTTSYMKYFQNEFSFMFMTEYKVVPSFSVFLENSFHFNSTYPLELTDYTKYTYASLNTGIRYYYKTKSNMKMGMGNNFHSNYLEIKVLGLPNYNYYNLMFKPYLMAKWGMQRRISNWGYIDVGPYISKIMKVMDNKYIWTNNDYIIGLNLQFGLGLGVK
ncbi:MAG: hypothetical protein JXB49_31205 [Bacteroidales bacterium]|nr:hypothetical protein [Bacteroidales bacterium]